MITKIKISIIYFLNLIIDIILASFKKNLDFCLKFKLTEKKFFKF